MDAIPASLGTKFLDQTVLGFLGLQRPDIVILHEAQKKAYLIDVTCPCDRPENLVAARRRKLDKYAAIRNKLQDSGYQVNLDAFVVGTLGTCDPENDLLLWAVGIGLKYGTLFKKLCCHDAIFGSYEVWADHTTSGALLTNHCQIILTKNLLWETGLLVALSPSETTCREIGEAPIREGYQVRL